MVRPAGGAAGMAGIFLIATTQRLPCTGAQAPDFVVVAKEDFGGGSRNIFRRFEPQTQNRFIGSPPDGFFGAANLGQFAQLGAPPDIADDTVADVSRRGIQTDDVKGIFGQGAPRSNPFFMITRVDSLRERRLTAQWAFRLRGASDVRLCIDMGGISTAAATNNTRMDFQLEFTASVDASPDQTAFRITAVNDDSGVFTTRPMDSGAASGGRPLEVTGDGAITKISAETGLPAVDTFLDKTPPVGSDGTGILDTFCTALGESTGRLLLLTMTLGSRSGRKSAPLVFDAAVVFDNIEVTGLVGRGLVASEDFDEGEMNVLSGFRVGQNLDGGPGHFVGIASLNRWPQREEAWGIPRGLVDDTRFDLSLDGTTDPTDREAIFGSRRDDRDTFFAIAATETFDEPATASWTFVIEGASDLKLCIGMGGISGPLMGGYSLSTDVTISVSFDGRAPKTAFQISPVEVDEAAGFVTRHMDNRQPSGGGRLLQVTGPSDVTKLLVEDGVEAHDTFLDKTPASDSGKGEMDIFCTFLGVGEENTGNFMELSLSAVLPREVMALDNIEITGNLETRRPLSVPTAAPTATQMPSNVENQFRTIQDVQQARARGGSTFVNVDVLFRDVWVTATQSNGFFIQEIPDPSVNTSSGIFVYTGEGLVPPELNLGALIEINGTVTEFSGETQLDDIELAIINNDARFHFAPVTVEVPVDSVEELENLEGMLVRVVPKPSMKIVVAETSNFDRFGQISVCAVPASQERFLSFTQVNRPNSTDYLSYLEFEQKSCFQIDDGIFAASHRLPLKVGGLYDIAEFPELVRGGNDVSVLVGPLYDRFERGVTEFRNSFYSVATFANLTFSSFSGTAPEELLSIETMSQPDVPAFPLSLLNKSITVAFSDVGNFFTTLDGNLTSLGREPQGADTEEELARQRQKLGLGLSFLDADILGLSRVENSLDNITISTLLSALTTSRNYVSATAEMGDFQVGNDAVKVDLIYDADRFVGVTTKILTEDSVNRAFNCSGVNATLAEEIGTIGSDPIFVEGANLVPVATKLQPIVRGNTTEAENITVIVSQFASRMSASDTAPGNEDVMDGAGSNNALRTRAACALIAWIDENPDGIFSSERIFILGDLNAFAMEDPIHVLQDAGYDSVLNLESSPAPFSVALEGQYGVVDYILANEAAREATLGSAIWNVNADEPDLLDYNLDHPRPGGLFDASEPHRFASHDTPMASFFLGELVDDGDFDFPQIRKGRVTMKNCRWLARKGLRARRYCEGRSNVTPEVRDSVLVGCQKTCGDHFNSLGVN